MDLHLQSTMVLNNGVVIPRLGLGVFQAKDGNETINAVKWALEADYRHIDTAAVYGNEAAVGKGMKDSGVARKDIFLTTKLWNSDMREGSQKKAFEKSLKRLDTDYVDLYLIHWPVKGKFVESWLIMEELYKEGKIRAIGVSNFHEHHLDDLLKVASVVPAVNQVECNPLLTQEPLKAVCDKHGIAFESWSPLGGGGSGNLTTNAGLEAIGKPYGKSAAQVMLRWHLQKDFVVIPKSVHKDRIIANADLYNFSLTDAEMSQISAMNKNKRSGTDPETFTF